MGEIKGIDTMSGLAGQPPDRIELDYNSVKAGEKLRQIWNSKYMGLLPYCFSCKEPVNWITPLIPDIEGVTLPPDLLFRCPKCKRVWVKDEEWMAKEATQP